MRSRVEFFIVAFVVVALFLVLRAQVAQSRTRQLAQAVRDGETRKALILITKGANVNGRDEDGDTIYTAAVRYNQPEIVTLLENHGALADAKTQLMAAALMNRPAVAEKLLAAGLNVNLKDRDGDTALAYAASWGHIEVVKTLLAHGADVNNRNDRNQTPLVWAAQCTDPVKGRAILKILKEAGAR